MTEDRSTLFTARNTEKAMERFTVVGFVTLVAIFLHQILSENKSPVAALAAVWESIPTVLSLATLLTIFYEGVDVMFTRLREYNDRRKRIIEERVAKESEKIRKEVREQLAKEFEERIEKVREEVYQQGYEAGKAESATPEE